jgi:hypothetical protein
VDSTESLTVARVAEEPFELVEPAMPENYVAQDFAVRSVSTGIQNLTLNDVLPVDDPKTGEIKFGTRYEAVQKNGVVVSLDTGNLLEEYYVKIKARYDEASDLGKGDARTSDSVAAKAMEIPAVTVQKINDQHQSWVYQIAKYQWDNLTKKYSSLITERVTPKRDEAGSVGPPLDGAGMLLESEPQFPSETSPTETGEPPPARDESAAPPG